MGSLFAQVILDPRLGDLVKLPLQKLTVSVSHSERPRRVFRRFVGLRPRCHRVGPSGLHP